MREPFRHYNLKLPFQGTEYHLDLVFRDTRVIVLGDSGTGNTLLYQILQLGDRLGLIDAVCYNYEQYRALQMDLADGHFHFTNKLVVLDNFDILTLKVPCLSDELNENVNNCFIIITRSGLGLDASPNTLANLSIHPVTHEIEFRYLFPAGMFS